MPIRRIDGRSAAGSTGSERRTCFDQSQSSAVGIRRERDGTPFGGLLGADAVAFGRQPAAGRRALGSNRMELVGTHAERVVIDLVGRSRSYSGSPIVTARLELERRGIVFAVLPWSALAVPASPLVAAVVSSTRQHATVSSAEPRDRSALGRCAVASDAASATATESALRRSGVGSEAGRRGQRTALGIRACTRRLRRAYAAGDGKGSAGTTRRGPCHPTGPRTDRAS